MNPRSRWLALVPALLLAATPALAHDLPAAEVARLNAWVAGALDGGWAGLLVLLGSGLALGALHGLEPGHAKTMMSAFIIAIGGTVRQAVLLGAAATVSHTAVVWLLVVPVLAWGGGVDFARDEPYFQIASAVAVLGIAGWTVLRVWRERPPPLVAEAGARTIDTGHGLARLGIESVDGAPRFVVRGVARSGREIAFHEDVTVETERAGGAREAFGFVERDGAKISDRPVPAPHDFVATLSMSHDNHGHAVSVPFGRAPAAAAAEGAADAHERAHVEALARQLAGGQRMTNWRVVLFGLSGGLLPCPAAITVLLLCLQLRRVGLGLLLVTSFSLGLALTMIAAGTVAALGARHLSRRFAGFAALARPATYASVALIVAIGVYLLVQGIDGLA